MSALEQTPVLTLRQQKVLNHLQSGVRTWTQLRTLTNINDDNLGMTLWELLSLRKIWTLQRGDVRVYGIEKRTDIVPRFARLQRRQTDSVAQQ